jgi:GNAT superfamily N-acetyltransferase
MRLLRATPTEIVARDALSWQAWGGSSRASFVADERALRDTPWSRRAHTAWSWHDDTGVLASCETYRVATHLEGDPGWTWEIASVYTEPALRGRGHASAMLEALAALLGREPGAQALVLFSDVGAPIYERLGFVARPAVDRVVTAEPTRRDTFRFLAEPIVPRHAPPGRFTLVPTAEQLGWHLARAERATLVGATAGDALAVWVDRPEDDELLGLVVAGGEGLHALLAAAAHHAGRARFRWWDTGEAFGEPHPRRGALPMIRPFVPFDPAEWCWIPRGVWV